MKRKLHKYLPQASDLNARFKILQIFGNTVLHSDLWQLRRHPFALGVAVGLFWTFIPIPFQMVMATLSSLLFRSNLPVSLLLCWITNPVTMPPIFYLNYRAGVLLLGDSALRYEEVANIGSISEMLGVLGDIWWSLYLGSFFLGTVFAICGYMLSTNLWKLVIIRRWHNRNNRRRDG